MTDVIVANSVSLANCSDDCPCQRVHIEFAHGDGECFAAIGISAEDARRLARELYMCADITEAQKAKVKGRVQ